ncbi:MAG: hypothetical protein SGJ18_03490 [Pseudomonadota bacterium]|nr:hypothetical protein [Pseudomonadota bacterium]
MTAIKNILNNAVGTAFNFKKALNSDEECSPVSIALEGILKIVTSFSHSNIPLLACGLADLAIARKISQQIITLPLDHFILIQPQIPQSVWTQVRDIYYAI